MARIPRTLLAGYIYHVINRGNGHARVFHKPRDYDAFLDLLAQARRRYAVKIFGFCLMPNHFHLVIEPETTLALSHFMQWLMTAHVRRYHRHYQSSGHVWQGRFKSFPIQRDEHLITVLRYVRQNPLRAGLVATESEWPWSNTKRVDLADPCPLEDKRVEAPLSAEQLRQVRECLNRQRPFGADEWQRAIK